MKTNSQNWMARYRAKIDSDAAVQTCAVCGIVGSKSSLERHHPYRRLGKYLLVYNYYCRSCHDDIEVGMHPEHLPRDKDHEKRFHGLKEGENFLKNTKDMPPKGSA